jgi:hypothetical protein
MAAVVAVPMTAFVTAVVRALAAALATVFVAAFMTARGPRHGPPRWAQRAGFVGAFGAAELQSQLRYIRHGRPLPNP